MLPFVPKRPTGPSRRHMGVPARTAEETAVTVGPGDTLWTIAAHHLGTDATDWEIAREWPRWHRHNITLIGPEPGELRAGTVLRAPPAPFR